MRTLRSVLTASLLSLSVFGACATGDDHDPALEAAYYEEAYETLMGDRADNPACSGIRVPDRSGFDRRVALTFDDGPNLTTTPKVVEILRRRGIPATFLMNGKNLRSSAAQELARSIDEDPLFIIGSHSQNHPNFATLSQTTAASEIDKTTALLEEAGAMPKYFRFPYGSATCTTAGMVRDRGYRILGWHIDTADWCFQSGGGTCRRSTFQYVDDAYRSDIAAWTLKQIRSNNGGIVLFHDVHSNTVANLEKILDAIEDAGFTFTNVDDVDTFPLLNGQTPTPEAPRPFVGTPCTTDAECGFTSGTNAGFCFTAGGFCTVQCEGYCADRAGFAPTFCIEDVNAETARGICAPVAGALNQQCAALPSTTAQTLPRFVGSTSAMPSERLVCAAAPATAE